MQYAGTNLLRNSWCYLAGSIDNSPDDGISIRQEIRNKLSYLNIKFLDPTDKPTKEHGEVGDEKKKWKELRAAGKYDELTQFAKQIRRVDLRLCDLSDFIIVYFDPDISHFGTLDELLSVEDQQKPVFCIVKGGKPAAPLWMFACVEHNDIFSSVDELQLRLDELNSSRRPLDRRWVLIRNETK